MYLHLLFINFFLLHFNGYKLNSIKKISIYLLKETSFYNNLYLLQKINFFQNIQINNFYTLKTYLLEILNTQKDLLSFQDLNNSPIFNKNIFLKMKNYIQNT